MTTETNNNRFDNEAQGWDEKPLAKEISSLSSSSILSHVNFESHMDVMDFGCGTGLISESILPKVKSVLGVDAAQGMVDVFNKKIIAKNLSNASAQYKVFLTEEDQLEGKKFDVIYSSFALHHVEDIAKMLKILAAYLKPEGGTLAIVDLEKTADTPLFHAKSKHGDVFHHGFSKDDLISSSLSLCPDLWASVDVFPSFSITKDLDDFPGQKKEFSALILVCKKK